MRQSGRSFRPDCGRPSAIEADGHRARAVVLIKHTLRTQSCDNNSIHTFDGSEIFRSRIHVRTDLIAGLVRPTKPINLLDLDTSRDMGVVFPEGEEDNSCALRIID